MQQLGGGARRHSVIGGREMWVDVGKSWLLIGGERRYKARSGLIAAVGASRGRRWAPAGEAGGEAGRQAADVLPQRRPLCRHILAIVVATSPLWWPLAPCQEAGREKGGQKSTAQRRGQTRGVGLDATLAEAAAAAAAVGGKQCAAGCKQRGIGRLPASASSTAGRALKHSAA